MTRSRTTRAIVIVSLLIFACTDQVPPESGVPDTAEEIEQLEEIPGAPADTLSWPADNAPETAENAINGVHGGGQATGSQDVLSLGYEKGVNNSVVLTWSDRIVLNGPGTDLVIFENVFVIGSGPNHFMDLLVVEVSLDNESWVAFPHDYLHSDETVYSADPAMWHGFAGRLPVILNEDSMRVDPFDQASAGGDHFDLDALPLDGGLAEQIRTSGFRYLRLVTAPSRLNPDTGALFVRDPASDGADIDGVYVRYTTADEIR